MAQQQQPPQQPGTPPAPAQGQTNGPNMSQMIMQMMAQIDSGSRAAESGNDRGYEPAATDQQKC